MYNCVVLQNQLVLLGCSDQNLHIYRSGPVLKMSFISREWFVRIHRTFLRKPFQSQLIKNPKRACVYRSTAPISSTTGVGSGSHPVCIESVGRRVSELCVWKTLHNNVFITHTKSDLLTETLFINHFIKKAELTGLKQLDNWQRHLKETRHLKKRRDILKRRDVLKRRDILKRQDV